MPRAQLQNQENGQRRPLKYGEGGKNARCIIVMIAVLKKVIVAVLKKVIGSTWPSVCTPCIFFRESTE
jgi:hypothetical protein